MYAVTVTFDIEPGQIGAFLPLMLDNARASRRDEPGCQQFDVCQEGNRVFLYEIYDDRAAFEAHMRTRHFKAFDAAVADMVAAKEVAVFGVVLR